MRICGIISEYNPFHSGHSYQIAQTRRALGADTAILCAMSGNFVQRGDFALLDKYARARMAVENGADLVLETPLAACLSSAEGFAYGGISLLHALSIVTDLSFGAETDDLALLQRAAVLTRDRARIEGSLKASLAEGLPYAAAMQRAVSALDPAAGAVFENPNNTLAVSYLAALHTLGSSIRPLAVLRAGAAHNADAPQDGFASAGTLRIHANDLPFCRSFMPDNACDLLESALYQGEAPVRLEAAEQAIIAFLRRLSPTDLAPFCGGEEGLENRLYTAVREQAHWDAICQSAQTRRYPLARVRRTLLRAWLDLPQALPPTPAYLRVLAIGPNGRALLSEISRTCALPVITKPVTEKRLPEALQPALRRDALADDLYDLALPDPDKRIGGGHFRKTPFCTP